MGFSVQTSVPILTVFLQGLLSFFSPCVLPLVPLYVSYLAGGAQKTGPDGAILYPRKTILINTLSFILGVSFTFFVLGLGFTALGRFFSDHRMAFARISGIIMILFGLYQFGAFGRARAIEQERRLPFRLDRFAMNPVMALLLGFTFSFAWTPCVGPTLGSVLLMASSSASAGWGFALIGVYTLGFVLPFLAVGLFTGGVLGFFKKHQKVVRYTVKAGAALLIFMGVMTLTGFMNGITSYLSALGTPPTVSDTGSDAPQTGAPQTHEPDPAADTPPAEAQTIPAPDFTLTDQFGNTHTLSDYQGKTIFLNFWTTWCPPCQGEMPDIQALYEKYGGNTEDLIVLGVANPKTADAPYNQDVTREEVEQFLADRNLTFPVVMDETGEIFAAYGIRAFPTTYMIDTEGNVFGGVASALTAQMMESIVRQTMDGERAS